MKAKTRIRKIRIDDIVPDPNQSRKRISEDDIMELAANSSNTGPAQPIIVRPSDDKFILIVWERCW